MDFKIKELSSTYIKSYIELLRNCFDNIPLNPNVEKMLENKNFVTLIALKDDKVIGAITIDKRYNYIKNIYFYILENVCTLKSYRNNHVATYLLKEVEKRAKLDNISYISFTSRNTREAAHKFYLKNNYQIKDTSVFIKSIN